MLFVANVWDAPSTVVAQKAGYQILGTSSAAIAATLGYEDGQFISFDELFYIVTRIKSVSNLPLSVDIEAGFGNEINKITDNFKRLAQLGVVGVNLEDSKIVNHVRELNDAIAFTDTIQAIRDKLDSEGYDLFFNIRTDTYLLAHDKALQETLLRGRLYKAAGADGLFVPCLTSENNIKTISNAIGLPLNIMYKPGLPSFADLKKVGVNRISMRNFLHSTIYSRFGNLMSSI
ncbi:isocitrate lyase/phosphoenolpyruvate mutase family protein (plasmid) [Serratia ureilytica]|uniref:isocitrate lyase/PEP mutase family protein n=1 Tax=Serratia ureilytica TaxID=300181 RepID=UPI001CBC2FC7|nr:isocitrate lyase/phosphoenolpyruvate mutase family protein [Serratia ureilytica]UAN29796.1 isocitrate lyase/phosphoenolpyruvate mutase family protein [Serratia ureilytica]